MWEVVEELENETLVLFQSNYFEEAVEYLEALYSENTYGNYRVQFVG